MISVIQQQDSKREPRIFVVTLDNTLWEHEFLALFTALFSSKILKYKIEIRHNFLNTFWLNIFFISGTIGFLACLWFVRKIYSVVKVDWVGWTFCYLYDMKYELKIIKMKIGHYW